MARFKLGFVAVLLVMPMAAPALTLGQVTVGSLFNQPLQAAIEIEAGAPGELDSLKIGLAPAARFAEQGVTRGAVHDALAFQIVRDGNTRARVLVTTDQPIKDVFLEFVLEAQWAGGQQVKGYTLLLDPPFTLDRAPDPIAIPTQQPAETTATVASPSPSPSKSVSEPRPGKREPSPARQTSSGEIRVNRGDTLWDIATRIKPEEAGVKQAVRALYLANPQAFADNNVNRLKSGAILSVPSQEEILAQDPEAAADFLAEHTRAWRSGTPVSPPPVDDEPEIAETEPAPAPVTKTQETPVGDQVVEEPPPRSGLLRLASVANAETVSPESSGSGDEGNASSTIDPAGFSDQLAVSREETAAARQETVELKARLDELSHQLDDARRLLELKDVQLARLQAFFAEQNEALVANPEATSSAGMAGDSAGTDEDLQPASGETAAAAAEAEMPAPEETRTDNGQEASGKTVADQAEEEAPEATDAAAVSDPSLEKAAEQAAEVASPSSLMRGSLAVVGGLLLVLGAALMALWYGRRKQAAMEEDETPEFPFPAGQDGGIEADYRSRSTDERRLAGAGGEDGLDDMLGELESEVDAQDVAVTAGSPGRVQNMAEVKLDLARIFVDLGDGPRARSLLEEVVAEGDDEQREQANGLLQSLA